MGETTTTNIERPMGRPFDLPDAIIFIIAVGLGLALAIVMLADAVRSMPQWRLETVAQAVSLGRMLSVALLYILFFLLPAFLIVHRTMLPPVGSRTRSSLARGGRSSRTRGGRPPPRRWPRRARPGSGSGGSGSSRAATTDSLLKNLDEEVSWWLVFLVGPFTEPVV